MVSSKSSLYTGICMRTFGRTFGTGGSLLRYDLLSSDQYFSATLKKAKNAEHDNFCGEKHLCQRRVVVRTRTRDSATSLAKSRIITDTNQDNIGLFCWPLCSQRLSPSSVPTLVEGHRTRNPRRISRVLSIVRRRCVDDSYAYDPALSRIAQRHTSGFDFSNPLSRTQSLEQQDLGSIGITSGLRLGRRWLPLVFQFEESAAFDSMMSLRSSSSSNGTPVTTTTSNNLENK
jgi:hypothetical protein